MKLSLPSLEEIRAEMARRRLLDFVLFSFPGYEAGWFAREVCEALDWFLGEVEARRSPRLILEAPPRHGKSEIVSRRFPAFAFGRFPDLSIIAASYGADLASRMNRDVQRVIDSELYHAVFPATALSGSNIRTVTGAALRNSDIFEIVGRRGCYRSAGVGGGITGMGADVLIVDDPIKDAEQAESAVYRAKVWEWFTSTAYTRLAPGGGVLLIMCMTGDTPVLMHDGTEKPLASIKAGDEIATYEDGVLSTSTVKNWKSQGSDFIFEIRTISGTIVKANERHPFLACRNGDLEWVRLRNLKAGDRLVKAIGPGSNAPSMDAKSLSVAKDSASRTTTRLDGLAECARRLSIQSLVVPPDSSTAMESGQRSTTRFSPSNEECAQCAESLQHETTPERIGASVSASITTTRQDECAASCATTATSPLGTEGQQTISNAPLDTFDLVLDEIVEIIPAGEAEVFDIQVERTENFIANGLVTHNTRWHEDDLAGRLQDLARRGEGETYRVLRFPAVAEHDEAHRKEGEALHPERYPLDQLERIRMAVGSRVWASLYQQRPAAAEGQIFKREHWRDFAPASDDPRALVQALGITRVIQSWDTAFKKGQANDYSVGLTIGAAPARYYLLDLWRSKVEFPELKRAVVAQAAKWTPNAVLVEDAAAGQSLLQELRRDTVLPLVPVKPDKDKVSRAHAITAVFEAGLCSLPVGASWVADFVDELASFPAAAHDDQVDTFTQGLHYLTQGGGARGLLDFMQAQAEQDATQGGAA